MRDIFAFLLATIVIIAAFAGIGFASYKAYEFYAPRYVTVDNKIFHESAQYNDGMIRDLSELQRQYIGSDDAGKAALRPIVRHRFEVYPVDKMPADLRSFYDSLK